MEALQVSIERYTREAMRGVQGSIPCGAFKFCKCQQEKDSLGRFFEGQPSVKVDPVQIRLGYGASMSEYPK